MHQVFNGLVGLAQQLMQILQRYQVGQLNLEHQVQVKQVVQDQMKVIQFSF